MKKILQYSPYLAALIPQFLISNYTIILISTILIGFFAAFKTENKKVFLKSFISALIILLPVFFIYQFRVNYVKNIFINFGLNDIFIYGIPIINALNTSILFFFGYTINSIFFKKSADVTTC